MRNQKLSYEALLLHRFYGNFPLSFSCSGSEWKSLVLSKRLVTPNTYSSQNASIMLIVFLFCWSLSEFGCEDSSSASAPTMVTVIVFSNTSSVPDALPEPGQSFCRWSFVSVQVSSGTLAHDGLKFQEGRGGNCKMSGDRFCALKSIFTYKKLNTLTTRS